MFTLRAAARAGCIQARWPVSRVPFAARSYHGLDQSKFLKVSEEIEDAVATKRPVVALESTIYTHGFPYPDNIALASLLESVVRVNGGVPATIGIHNGIARVGLDPSELIELAESGGKKSALKVSRRDLGYICGLGMTGRRLHGGTTISGTMVLAKLAGIKIFGTGGLGGVHRGGEMSMDISADLTELGRTPVTVISSGCKSFLDIPRTLEYLETEGVCIATFADGRQGPVDFPAFFSRESGVRSPKVVQNEVEAAAIIYAQSKLPVSSGIHFANPVPLPNAIPKSEMDKVIEEAVRLADVEGRHGSDNTPFVLSKIQELSGGKSVAANRALVESNVKLATKVAVELAKLERPGRGQGHSDRRMSAVPIVNPDVRREPAASKVVGDTKTAKMDDELFIERLEKADVLVAGSLAVDLSCDYASLVDDKANTTPALQTSNPAVIGQSLGGVGYNVAIAAKYMGSSVLFCSNVADDLSGRAALSTLRKEGLRTEGIQALPASPKARTAQYVAINDAKKDLLIAMADMSIMELPEKELDFEGFWEPMVRRTKPRWVVIDANWTSEVLARWVKMAKKYGSRIAFEPVSTPKSCRIFSSSSKDIGLSDDDCVPNNKINLAAPNKLELAAMHMTARETGFFDSAGWWRVIDAIGLPSTGCRQRLVAMTSSTLVDEGTPQQSIQLLPFIPCIITKLGAEGVLLTQLLGPGDPRLTSPESLPYILGRASTTDGVVGGVYMRLFPAAEKLEHEDIVSVNGAGDTLLGTVVSGLTRTGGGSTNVEAAAGRMEDLIPVAQEASVRTLKSPGGVSSSIVNLRKRCYIHE